MMRYRIGVICHQPLLALGDSEQPARILPNNVTRGEAAQACGHGIVAVAAGDVDMRALGFQPVDQGVDFALH